MPVLFSIIMPVHNEAGSLAATLRRLQSWRAAGHELIVVDGRSTDASVEIATGLADAVLSCDRGRARQMHVGALHARGRVLLFLHADTQLPGDALEALSAQLDHGAQWGWFDAGFDSASLAMRVIAFAMNTRARLTRVCTGDQCLFVERETYFAAGGFPLQPLMEDVEFSKRLRALSRPAPIETKVITAARRWREHGVIRTVLLMWDLRLRYFFGASPQALHRRYYPAKRSAAPWRYPHAQVIAFAKSPVAGQVKTRLIPALGAQGALELQLAMLNRLGSLLSTARLCPWHFAVAGKLEVGVFYAYGNEPRLQRGEDLGERMRYAAEDCFAGGTEFVLLVGGDVPALSAKLLERAIKALEGASDVVFVPAQDGGYVLLGMRRMIPELFEGPEWGGENVLAKSLEILKGLGLRAECLETLWDVDVPADLALLEQLDPPLDWAY